MIRLTLRTYSEPEIHFFSQSTILIGTDPSQADLVIPEKDLEPVHLKIAEQNGFIILTNLTNDPFVSINGHPFGKKLLNSGDIILVHDKEILFEFLHANSPPKQETKEPSSDPVAEVLDQRIKAQDQALAETKALETLQTPSFLDIAIPFEEDVELLQQEEWSPIAIEQYLKEIEKDPHYTEAPPLSGSPTSTPTMKETSQKAPAKSLKDDYLRDLEDDHSPPVQDADVNHLYQAWKWIIFVIFLLISFAVIAGAVIYLTVSDKTEAQETKAAQGVADITMALAHARLHQLKPHNQNWSDADFLKSNLKAILPDMDSHAAAIDSQGQFNKFPYSLRIYTNRDLSRFLLIAQPAPSLLQWLIPKSIIVVDSDTMELRTLKDVRNLNRLLANTEPLEGTNGSEIAQLVRQGQLVQLSTLAAQSIHNDFAPPKNLEWVYPGSENFIYNAPRYFRLSQNLVQKAIILSTSKGTSQEVTSLKQDVENFSRLNHLILYTDQGKQQAALVKQGLKTFAPSDNIFFGYVNLNNKGKIEQAHLLKDEDEEIKDLNNVALLDDSIALSKEMASSIKKDSPVDANHPIYIQLLSLAHTRETELKPLLVAINHLLDHELRAPHPHFQAEFQKLSYQYLMANAKHKRSIREALGTLYDQYENMPIDQFISFVKGVGFDHLIQQNTDYLSLAEESCIQNLEHMLGQIEQASTMVELDNLMHIACSWLTFDYIKEPNELINYQNLIRNRVIEKLEGFLLSHETHLASDDLDTEEQEAIRNILGYEKLIRSDEQEYFLEELNDILTSGKKEK